MARPRRGSWIPLRSSGVLLCLFLALARTAAAAPPDPQAVAEAKRRYAEGEKRFAAGDLAGAAEAFKEAFRLTSNPILLYNLGFVYDKQGDATLAVLYYEKFLADAPDTPRLKEKRIEVTSRVAALKAASETPVPVPEPPLAKPPELGHDVIAEAPPAKPIDVTARPPADSGWSYTLFYRDGGEGMYQSLPLKQRLGELVARIPSAVTRARTVHYYLEARTADGRLVASSGKANAPNVIYIDPAAPPHYYRDEASETMSPPPAPDVPVVAPTPIAPPRDRGASALGIGKWVATGGAMALIGTGIALYFVSADYAHTLEDEASLSRTECATPPCRVYTDARKDLEAKGKRFRTWGHVAVVAGGATLVGAAILWYFDLRGPHEPAVAPVVGPGVVGASATVRF
jgi:hypothetical protein